MSKWKEGDSLISSSSDRALDGIQSLALYSRSNPALGIERLGAIIANAQFEKDLLLEKIEIDLTEQ